MEGTPFPESTTASAVLVNGSLDGREDVGVWLRRCDKLLVTGRQVCRHWLETADHERHQANAAYQQNEEQENRTYTEQHQFKAFEQEFA